jgi:hypothetical protein
MTIKLEGKFIQIAIGGNNNDDIFALDENGLVWEFTNAINDEIDCADGYWKQLGMGRLIDGEISSYDSISREQRRNSANNKILLLNHIKKSNPPSEG